MSKIERVTILGTGPAGLTAAIYTARANLEPLVVEGMQPGGQLTITSEVDNYPGYPDGIQGPEMMVNFRKQAERFGTRFIQGDVKEVDLSSRPFKLIFADGSKCETNSLIVSTGASAKWLGLDSEQKLMGKGVSACATCDAFFYKGQEVVVIGGGDTAMEEATHLAKFADKVTVVHRRRELRASKFMQDKALNNSKIEWEWDSGVEEVLGTDGVEGVRLKNLKTGETKDISCKGYFVAIGHKPNTDIFGNQLDQDETGYLKVQAGSTRTNVEGVFAAGDVADKVYRQAVTAAGTGCMAALDAERFLETKGEAE